MVRGHSHWTRVAASGHTTAASSPLAETAKSLDGTSPGNGNSARPHLVR